MISLLCFNFLSIITSNYFIKYNDESFAERLRLYLNPIDGRYEDLKKGNWKLNVVRDLTAGLVVAMVAIPLARGFAMASGLRPEQGIVGGASSRVSWRSVRGVEISGLWANRCFHPFNRESYGQLQS